MHTAQYEGSIKKHIGMKHHTSPAMDCYYHSREEKIWRYSGTCQRSKNWHLHNTQEQDYLSHSAPVENYEAVVLHFESSNASHYACSLCGREEEKTAQKLMIVALTHIQRHHLAVSQPFLIRSKGLMPNFTSEAHGELTIHEMGA